jgi:hypothetical protein
MIETEIFTIGRGKLFKKMIFKDGFVWITITVLLAILFVALGIAVDLRWLVVSLVLLAIVLPMIVSFIYISRGMTFENSLNALPHLVKIRDKGVEIKLYTKRGESDDDALNIEEKVFSYECGETENYGISSDGIYLPIHKVTKGCLYLPYSSFKSKDDFSQAIEILRNYKK